jgi:hypothetical protein
MSSRDVTSKHKHKVRMRRSAVLIRDRKISADYQLITSVFISSVVSRSPSVRTKSLSFQEDK